MRRASRIPPFQARWAGSSVASTPNRGFWNTFESRRKLAHMKKWIFACLIATASVVLLGQSKQSPIEPKLEPQTDEPAKKRPNENSGNNHGPVDLLSDTGGMDVHPYISRVLPLIRTNWYQLIPESAANKQGKVIIRFNIMKNGQISDVRIVEKSGDSILDKAAFKASALQIRCHCCPVILAASF